MRPLLHGILASLALSAVYIGIVSIVQGPAHAIAQFVSLWYLMMPLIAGFGVQVGLFSYIRSSTPVSMKSVSASGGVSTMSMVACCAHHLTDVLPLLGLTAAALFLAQYQIFFIALGIASNLIGAVFMLSIIQDKRLYKRRSSFAPLFRHDMKKAMKILLVASVPLLMILFLFLSW